MSRANQSRTLPKRQLSDAPVDPLPPALYPPRTAMDGRYVRLEPVDVRKHATDLFEAGHADESALKLWDYLPYGPFGSEGAFATWLRDRSAMADPIFFAIIDRERSVAQGMASMMDIQPLVGAIEIGHIWFAPPLQQSRAATEALYLMMACAMDDLGYRRLQWKCNALNQPSRNAALRLGFDFEGVLYHHQVPKGRNRDTAYYSILDYEWPLIRENFETWLEPGNFDDAGQQTVSLGDLNRALRE